ncbi:MAG: MgtC/SapB family protein [Sphingobacteriales bacterium]
MSSIFNITDTDLLKIGLAVVCGGLLGLERQYKNKIAGFRTIILICLGSAIFTMVAQHAGQVANINIVTGVGFIGAGVIFKDNISVSGLTTAAVIWISAAIGMAVGSGNYMVALISTVVTLTVLLLFNLLELYIDKIHHDKLYVIVFNDAQYDNLNLVKGIIKSHNLKSKSLQITKKDCCFQVAIMVTGYRENINHLDEKLMRMPEIKSF